ncbi:MAG: 50S ribosomal protein L13 [Candidatus Pacebacteria bacterium]|nr:50S ribosomal protein L13 [Candidatus Paceibacterota bacterium]
MEYYIDAEGKILGKLATEIAQLLRGKNKPSFVPYKDEGDVVIVKNIRKIKLTGKKEKNKMYYRHSGYLGSLKTESFEKIFARDPEKVLKQAVLGMLPPNKLRAIQIKRLKIEK